MHICISKKNVGGNTTECYASMNMLRSISRLSSVLIINVLPSTGAYFSYVLSSHIE